MHGYTVDILRERPGYVERLQPLGYLAWAACGKDPGFTPQGILEEARRSSRYSVEELAALAFDGPPPLAADLARHWHRILVSAAAITERLPADRAGQAVLTHEGRLFTGDAAALERALRDNVLVFHAGRLGGALPVTKR